MQLGVLTVPGLLCSENSEDRKVACRGLGQQRKSLMRQEFWEIQASHKRLDHLWALIPAYSRSGSSVNVNSFIHLHLSVGILWNPSRGTSWLWPNAYLQ